MYDKYRFPSRPAASSLGDLPAEYVDALKRTPRGLAALERLKAFDRQSFRSTFKLTVTEDPLAGSVHGTTIGTSGGVETVISVYNQTPKDRMEKWLRPEIINIVGVHEVGHIVFSETDAQSDECACFYCHCHEKVIIEELVARFQYSLIHPTEATGKSGWLENYFMYFAKAIKMRSDKKYMKLCQELLATRDLQRFGDLAAEAKAYEGEDPPTAPFDTSYGKGVAFDAYKAALGDMEALAAVFLSRPILRARAKITWQHPLHGVYQDIGPYKDVLQKIAAYKEDSTFSLIP